MKCEPAFLGGACDVDVQHLRLPLVVFPPMFAGPPYVLYFDLGWWITGNGWACVVDENRKGISR